MSFDINKYYLRSTSFFESLGKEETKGLISKLIRKEYEKDEFLFRQNSYPKGIYLVKRGKIKIFQTNLDGKQTIVTIYKKGDYFGHRPLLAGEVQPVSAVSLTSAVVSFLPREEFFSQLSSSPEFSKSLLVNLSQEFSIWVNKSSAFSQFSVKTRTALSLLILANIYQRDTSDKSIVINLGRDDFAAFVGTAKETLVRMLRQFKDEKIISSFGSKITLLRPKALISLVEAL